MPPRLGPVGKLVTYGLLGLAVVILFPIYYMVLISLKLPKDIPINALALAGRRDAQELRRSAHRSTSSSTSATASWWPAPPPSCRCS